jgi:hypothetical protein
MYVVLVALTVISVPLIPLKTASNVSRMYFSLVTEVVRSLA